jgi:hypothetical protein
MLLSDKSRVTESDARLAGLILSAARQAWAGALGGPPVDGSPLATDLAEERKFATDRLPNPIRQAWAYSQTAGLVALDHLRQLEESLIHFANGAGSCPISTVDTLTRVALEAYAVQRWIVDPTIDTWERYKRWICVETLSVRASWTMLHEGEDHAKNPALIELYEEADRNQLRRHPKGEWIGAEEPKAADLASQLLSRFAKYVPNHLSSEDAAKFGRLMYRMMSGAVHTNAGHVLSSLVPTGDLDDGVAIRSYALTKGTLWRCVTAALLAKFTAGCEYGAWIGRPVPAEARRLMLSHFDTATARLG